MPEKIPVSHLALAYRCPVYLYLSKRRGLSESERSVVCKQVASHLGEPLDPIAIWSEITTIMPEINPSMEHYCLLCVQQCNKRTWERYSDNQVAVKSELFGIRGVVDKLDSYGQTFAISRASDAPETGIWRGDALRMCAYMYCVEETSGWKVKKARVEYIPSGIMREWTPTLHDRRNFIRMLSTVKKIENGAIPRKPHNAPCIHCAFQGSCGGDDPVRLSDLL